MPRSCRVADSGRAKEETGETNPRRSREEDLFFCVVSDSVTASIGKAAIGYSDGPQKAKPSMRTVNNNDKSEVRRSASVAFGITAESKFKSAKTGRAARAKFSCAAALALFKATWPSLP